MISQLMRQKRVPVDNSPLTIRPATAADAERVARLAALDESPVPQGDVLLVPVGATEQHGPHLPLNTDTVIATSACAYASSRTGAPVAPALRYTRDRTVEDLWGFCRSCYYADECASGCTWTSVVTLGRPGNNPYCHHRALEMERAGKRERVVRATEAPGLPFDHGTFAIIVEDL